MLRLGSQTTSVSAASDLSQVLHEMYHKYHDEWIVDLLYKDCVRIYDFAGRWLECA